MSERTLDMIIHEGTAGEGLDRRRVLRIGAALAAMAVALGPAPAEAAPEPGAWPKQAFDDKSQPDVLKALYGEEAEPSDKITLEAPEIAENGAVVPLSVSTSLPDVTSISILVPENPFTLAASYDFPEGTTPAVSCRLKMAKTSPVIAVVKSGGKLFTASRDVKVTLGGCGG